MVSLAGGRAQGRHPRARTHQLAWSPPAPSPPPLPTACAQSSCRGLTRNTQLLEVRQGAKRPLEGPGRRFPRQRRVLPGHIAVNTDTALPWLMQNIKCGPRPGAPTALLASPPFKFPHLKTPHTRAQWLAGVVCIFIGTLLIQAAAPPQPPTQGGGQHASAHKLKAT